MFQTKVAEKIKKYLMFNKFFFRQLCSLWDNVEKYCRAGQATYDKMIQHMHFPCWITKAKKQHSEFVTLLAFPLQVWLQERTLVARYTYVHCLPCYTVQFSSYFIIVMLAYYRITVHDLDINEALNVIVTFSEVTMSWSRVFKLFVSKVVILNWTKSTFLADCLTAYGNKG
jgi:hypothetical protein